MRTAVCNRSQSRAPSETFPNWPSRLRGARRPTGRLNAELLCVDGVQSLPAVALHGIGAGHALKADPVPVLTSASETSIAVNSRNTTLTPTGNGFLPGAVALWNGSPRSTTFAALHRNRHTRQRRSRDLPPSPFLIRRGHIGGSDCHTESCATRRIQSFLRKHVREQELTIS